MDDFTSNILNDSKNEWSILLINLITSHIIDGFRSIFNEAIQLCQTNDEPDKYLMTYQNLLSRIPNWNQNIIQVEKDRIIAKSKCSYLEDLITCVHIIQLKLLSCVRVGSENKKINIDIPDFTIFLHKIYINIARKLYSNIYLFEIDIPPLEQQRRNREFELLVQTSIMNTIRDNLPVENLLRQYIDETQEVDVSKVETVVENKPLLNQKKKRSNLWMKSKYTMNLWMKSKYTMNLWMKSKYSMNLWMKSKYVLNLWMKSKYVMNLWMKSKYVMNLLVRILSK